MYSTAEKIQFLVRAFGTSVVGGDKQNIAVSCPACAGNNKNKKKLAIRIDNDHYQCWVCGIKGRNLLSILRKYSPAHLEEYKEKFLDKKYKRKIQHDQKVENEVLVLPKGFTLLVTSTNALDPDIKDVIRYAESRGISKSDMWKFGLGTCTTGKYRRRLIIPSFSEDGELNYFVARRIDDSPAMKYLNAKVPKKDVVFNELRICWDDELTIVEGPLDLVKCDDNATCLLGSQIREGHALFTQVVKNQTPVILALDPDAIEKTHKFAKNLASYGISVKILNTGDFDDVGDMSRADFLKAKKAARPWTEESRLFYMIDKIKSGSII